ncbi:MAG: DNA polymerase III subunit delta' [Paracoccaceae bacterium]
MAETPEEPDREGDAPHPCETSRLYGQGAAEARFLAAWSGGRLHHAWLLRGPRGIGKATLAYRIARARLATPDGAPPPDTLDAAEDCPIRRRILAGAEPRLKVLRRSADPKTGRVRAEIGVDEVREVKRFLSLRSADGGWRAVIVDAADEMTRAAANALLKVLEEPPARTVLLLVAHAPGRLLPTIRSRCRGLDLAPLGPEPLSRALADLGATPAPGEAGTLAALAGGSVGRALLLSRNDGAALYLRLAGLFDPERGLDRPALVALAEETAGRGAGDRLTLTADLTALLLARLARAAVTGGLSDPVDPAEARLASDLAPAAAPRLAEALSRIATRTAAARAVNLDAAQTILDTFLDLEAVLAGARAGR